MYTPVSFPVVELTTRAPDVALIAKCSVVVVAVAGISLSSLYHLMVGGGAPLAVHGS